MKKLLPLLLVTVLMGATSLLWINRTTITETINIGGGSPVELLEIQENGHDEHGLIQSNFPETNEHKYEKVFRYNIKVLDTQNTYSLDISITGSGVDVFEIIDITPTSITLNDEFQEVHITVSLKEGEHPEGNTEIEFDFVATIIEESEIQPTIFIDFEGESFPAFNSYTESIEAFGDFIRIKYGNVVTSGSPVYGEKHVLLRVAQNTSNIAYLEYGETNFDISKITFQARVSSLIGIITEVSFSEDGVTWSTPIIVEGIATTYSDLENPFEVESNITGARYFRILAKTSTIQTQHRDLLLDDISIFE